MSETVGLRLVPWKKERLGDQLYGQILEQIVSGALAEGDKLPSESRICRSFGVSRPTVREALLRLHADGLVVSRQGAGSFVCKRPSAHLVRLAGVSDVAGLLRCLEVRIGLEGQAAALAATRHTPAQLDRIATALAAMRSSFERGSPPVDEDYEFHQAVASASGNGLFAELLAAMHDTIRHSMTVALGITREGSKERAARVIEEHEAVADAIAHHDSEAANLAMRYHLYRARQRITDQRRDQ